METDAASIANAEACCDCTMAIGAAAMRTSSRRKRDRYMRRPPRFAPRKGGGSTEGTHLQFRYQSYIGNPAIVTPRPERSACMSPDVPRTRFIKQDTYFDSHCRI